MKFYERTWFVIIMLIFFFPLGLFLMWKFKDWTKGVKWIVTVIVVLVAIIGFATDENDGEEKKQETNTSTDSKEHNKDSKDDKKEKAEKTESKENNEDKKSSEKEKNEDITHKKQDGYDVYERDGGMPFSENSSVKHFSMEMSNKLKKDYKNIDKGAVFKDVMEFEDKKGNESKMVAVVVYISKDSIDEINFENWPKNPESLYDVADGVVFHAYINNNDVAETRDQDEIPQEFYDMLGEEK